MPTSSTLPTPSFSTPSASASPTPRAAAPFIPHRRISGRTALWSVLLGVGLVAPTLIIAGLMPLPATPADASRPARFLEFMLHPGILLLKAVVLAPLWEEVFYRGVILQLARRYLSPGKALALSAVIFAVPHAGMGFGTAALALLIGVALAWIVVRTGSLYASALCHAAVNFSWFFVLGPVFGITDKIIHFTAGSAAPNPLTDLFPIWWIALSVALIASSFVMLARDNSPSPSPAD